MSEHKSLAEALLAFQAEAPTLKKDATNPHFRSKFTPLDTIVETVQPLLAAHGLTWSTYPCYGPDNQPALGYKLMHAGSGEETDGVMPLLVTKTDPQGMGSAITYARRYSISAVLNLVSDDDDDGNGASRPRQQQQKTTNGHAEPEVVSLDDIKRLQQIAKGLDAEKIKLAMTACGIPIPDPLVWNKVPKAKAPLLAEALAGAKA